jgi:hypothetical protein
MKKAISDQLHEKFLIERKSVYEKFPTVFYEEGSGESTEATVSANEKVAADRVVEFRKRIPEIVTAEEAHRKVSRIITGFFLALLASSLVFVISSSMKLHLVSFAMMIATAVVMIAIAWLSITERFFVSRSSKKSQSPTFDLEHLVATDILADFGIGEEYLEEEDD